MERGISQIKIVYFKIEILNVNNVMLTYMCISKVPHAKKNNYEPLSCLTVQTQTETSDSNI